MRRTAILLLFCILVAGCISPAESPETPATPIPAETSAPENESANISEVPENVSIEPEAPRLSLSPTISWDAKILPSSSVGWVNTPTADEKNVYISSDYRRVQAFDKTSGELLWEFEHDSQMTTPPTLSGGRVYAGSNDGKVHSLDKETGEKLWDYDGGAKAYSTPIVHENLVYSATEADDVVFALKTDDGSLVWEFETGRDIYSSPILVENQLVIGSNYNGLYAFDLQTGREYWNFPINGEVHTPTACNGSIYIGSGNGYLYGVRGLNGGTLWEYDADIGRIGRYKHVWDSINAAMKLRYSADHHLVYAPACDGEQVYIGSLDKNLHALDAGTGELLWKFETGASVISTPTVSNGVVYFGSNDKFLYALNTTDGALIWKHEFGGKVGSPIIYEDKLFVVTREGYLYAFR